MARGFASATGRALPERRGHAPIPCARLAELAATRVAPVAPPTALPSIVCAVGRANVVALLLACSAASRATVAATAPTPAPFSTSATTHGTWPVAEATQAAVAALGVAMSVGPIKLAEGDMRNQQARVDVTLEPWTRAAPDRRHEKVQARKNTPPRARTSRAYAHRAYTPPDVAGPPPPLHPAVTVACARISIFAGWRPPRAL